MKKKGLLTFLFVMLAIGMAALPFVSACAQAASPAPAKMEIEIYSAKFGGIMYLQGVGLAELLNKTHPWLRATNIETFGVIENIKKNVDVPEKRAKALRGGTANGYWAATLGQAPLFDKKYDMKAIFSYAISFGLFATSDPKIKGPQDMIGKKVGVGEKGSGFLAETQFLLRDCWGIWDKIKPEYLGFEAAKDAFRDGLIDVVYSPSQWLGGNKFVIHPLMGEVIRTKKDVSVIGLSKGELERGRKATGWPVSPLTVPAGAIAPNVPAQDTTTFVSMLIWWAYPEMDEKVVYEIVKTAHQNIAKFGEIHTSGKVMGTPGVMAWLPAATEAYVHPGALKYYKEHKIKVSIGGASPSP